MDIKPFTNDDIVIKIRKAWLFAPKNSETDAGVKKE